MIKLEKLEEPSILSQNKGEWQEQYLQYYDHDSNRYTKKANVKIPNYLTKKYNNKDIKEQLLNETRKKCAYCESKMLHITYSDIEHIKPKAHRPDLIFEWSNLTVACEACNRRYKNDYFNETAPLINPFIEDPEAYLYALGPLIRHIGGNNKGLRSHTIIGLNRPELIEERIERINNVSSMIDLWHAQTNEADKEMIYRQLLREMEPTKEYSLVIKHLFIAERII